MYETLKALHVVAVVTWVGGMAFAAALAPRLDGGADGMRWTYTRLVSPAMVVALASGLVLAADAGWFRATWLQVKLGPVLVLTGLHGMLSGRLRRSSALAMGAPRAAGTTGLLAAAVLALLAVAAWLAVAKPGATP